MRFSTTISGRRPARRTAALALGTALSVIALAACGGGGGGGGDEEAAETKISAETVPDYYGAAYQDVIDGAKEEGGKLTIYSNTAEENWAPIFRDFKRKYPFVEEISANDLDSDEVFQRVLSEQATSGSPVDLVVSNASSAWANFAERDDTLLSYESPEITNKKVPDFAQLLPNVTAISTDPMTIAYNTQLVEEKPDSIAKLAELVKADPDKFKDKITVRDVESSFGYSVSEAFTKARPDSWTDLEQILPMSRPESSSGTQTEKILAGEYLVGFFISGAPAYPVVKDSGGLFDVAFPKDGTSVLPRGIGIASKSKNPNTSKLFVDFLLSEEGQTAVAEGGLTSFREGISGPGLHTYQELEDEVGADNVIFVNYAKADEQTVDTFLDRWNGLVKK